MSLLYIFQEIIFQLNIYKLNKVFDISAIFASHKGFKLRNYFNSKNTKYLYVLFPFLVLPSTISEEISDILRGYILQYFAWRFNGYVIYISSQNYKTANNVSKKSNFTEEKNLFYNLDI